MTKSDMHQFLDLLPRHLLEPYGEYIDLQVALYQDALANGKVDRARLRDCLEAYGRVRVDILTHFGLDPASEELMPLPAQLHDA
jgi:hypothetical protein